MSKLTTWMLVFLALGAVMVTPARAEEEAVEEEDYDDESTTEEYDDEDYEEEEEYDGNPFNLHDSSDISTTFLFPDNPNKQFGIGEDAKVLVLFSNTGDEGYNISYIGAQLHSPFDLSYYIQNFTAKQVFTHVPAHSELSIEYTFTPDASLEPLEFWLSGYVFYNNSLEMPFKSTYTNGTVELVEPKSAQGTSFTTYLLIIAAVAGAYFYNQQQGSSKTAKFETGTKKSSSGDGWDTPVYKQSKKSRSARKNKSKGKKNN